MTTTLPPSPAQQIAASLDWETATLDDAWRQSDETGVPACAILRSLKQVGLGDTQLVN